MRHPLHALCPYFAMFPEQFVAKQLLAYTRPGEIVFDPFCGRGTTILESLLSRRPAGGVDINPVAACIAGAKADPPALSRVKTRLAGLEAEQKSGPTRETPDDEFFRACFHPDTLGQISFLRQTLRWNSSKVDRFIAAVLLSCLHGESHKSQNYLSNRMPRTISTKPDYSVRWWKARNMVAPRRDAFEVIRRLCEFRLSNAPLPIRGSVKLRDARSASSAFPQLRGKVKLIVTSPPYLDTTDYHEDQWLRLWFLGGATRPSGTMGGDDRHIRTALYWKFLREAWSGCAGLLQPRSFIVVRIGGTKLPKERLLAGLRESFNEALANSHISPLDKGTTTEIKNRQTNAFRPGTHCRRYEHDFAFELKSRR
jgi:DNA methylase